jgi:hypothetical protein
MGAKLSQSSRCALVGRLQANRPDLSIVQMTSPFDSFTVYTAAEVRSSSETSMAPQCYNRTNARAVALVTSAQCTT